MVFIENRNIARPCNATHVHFSDVRPLRRILPSRRDLFATRLSLQNSVFLYLFPKTLDSRCRQF